MNQNDKNSQIDGDLKQRIEKTIANQRVMLFMKGNPAMPQCGFSATVVGILKQVGIPFGSFNILADQELREGLKQYSNWPTYPQLYFDGKLVGGCDIVREMHASGELESLLKAESASGPAGSTAPST
jgi:monothiol glutaredoxin